MPLKKGAPGAPPLNYCCPVGKGPDGQPSAASERGELSLGTAHLGLRLVYTWRDWRRGREAVDTTAQSSPSGTEAPKRLKWLVRQSAIQRSRRTSHLRRPLAAPYSPAVSGLALTVDVSPRCVQHRGSASPLFLFYIE